jgi:hypothetical protein
MRVVIGILGFMVFSCRSGVTIGSSGDVGGVLVKDTGEAEVADLADEAARVVIDGRALHQNVAALEVA